MIEINEIQLKSGPEKFNILSSTDSSNGKPYVNSTHINKSTVDFLNNYINDNCKKIVIESPYMDKDYLSSVYRYYIKSNKSIIKWCYRLHLYGDNEYYGYIVLRPTPFSNIGRIQASPIVFISSPANLIVSNYTCNIVGKDETVKSFLFSQQDPVVAMCAQVATWSVLQQTNNLRWSHSDMKFAEITDKTWTFSERKIPAKGLNANHIMEILNSAGLFPIYNGITKTKDSKMDEVLSYIQSGIPVIALATTEKHAITLIGYGEVSKFTLDSDLSDYYEKIRMENKDNKIPIIMYSSLIESIYINDDNIAPYQKLTIKNKSNDSLIESPVFPYNHSSLESFIVPLKEKMYISYQSVYEKTIALLLSEYQKEFSKPLIVRIYLSLAKSFKRETFSKNMNTTLKDVILHLETASYLWCVEISSIESHNKDEIDGLIIFDATRHIKEDKPWILIQTPQRIIYSEEGEFHKKEGAIAPYGRYCCNLQKFN